MFLYAYGINENLLAYLHSYLSNRKQCVRINNVTREFETIIPGVPQGSMGVQIDDQLNFNLYISNICRSAANQLNALIRLKRFPAFEEKKTLVNSYFYSNFSYCPLVWMFSSAKSLKKVESLQKIALRFLYDNCDSSYESLLKLARKSTMNVTRLRSLCIEIFKTLNNINPVLMNEIFELRKTKRAVRNQYNLNLEVPIINQVTFGPKSIRYLGPKIWNSLPFHIKSSERLTTFKRIIKNWDTVSCKCPICQR